MIFLWSLSGFALVSLFSISDLCGVSSLPPGLFLISAVSFWCLWSLSGLAVVSLIYMVPLDSLVSLVSLWYMGSPSGLLYLVSLLDDLLCDLSGLYLASPWSFLSLVSLLSIWSLYCLSGLWPLSGLFLVYLVALWSLVSLWSPSRLSHLSLDSLPAERDQQRTWDTLVFQDRLASTCIKSSTNGKTCNSTLFNRNQLVKAHKLLH